jgi:hypothetical protein
MHENSAYAHLDLTQKNPKPQKSFVGHPFTCDRPEVFLTLVQTGEKEFLLSANNPTTESMNVKITKSKFFDLTTKDEMSVEIAAGDEIVLKL